MSKPIHGRGTAAEQGAAIRRQMEEKEQKRQSAQQPRPERSYQPPPVTPNPRAVPPTHTSDEAAAQPVTRRSSNRKSTSRRAPHSSGDAPTREKSRKRRSQQPATAAVATSEEGRAKRGSRTLRQKVAEEEHEQQAPPADEKKSRAGGVPLLGGFAQRRSQKPKEGKGQDAAQPAAEADHADSDYDEPPMVDDDAAEEAPADGHRSPSKSAWAGAAGAAGVAGSRRRNYAAKRDGQGPVYATEDGEEHGAKSSSAAPVGADSSEEEVDVESEHEQDHAAALGTAGASAAAARQPVKLESRGRVYPLTGIDNVALLMEDAGYQTACFSVYLFKTVLDYDTVHNFFVQLADAYPKYRYVCELDPSAASKKDKAARKGKPSPAAGADPGRKTRYSKSLKAGGPFRPARWRIDENFNLEDNIVVVDAPGRGDDDALFDICGEVLGTHFDYSKPLWEATLVHGLKTSEGARSALMIKIHHAFSDGQGMIQSYHSAIEAMQQGVSIADKQSQLDSQAVQASKAKQGASEKASKDNGEQKKVGSRNVKATLGGTISHSWHTIRGLYFRRREEFNYSDAEAQRSVKAMGGELSKNCRPSGRLYAHSDGIAMSDIKLVRQAFSTDKINLTLNDVASAILSRALRIAAEQMAQKSGRKVRDKRVAVFIPISKRPKGDWTLANYTTGAIAWFRFHNPSHYGFEQLLHQVHREMNRIKRSHLPQWWFYWFNVICKRRAMQLPNYPIFRQIFQAAYREYHVFTNLPGPAKPVKFGKHEAFSYHVLPPSSPGRSTMAIGTISYAQDFSLAVSCDATTSFKDRELTRIICNAFQEASQELVAAAKERASFIKG